MKLFISYRSSDSGRVDTIVTHLRSLKDEQSQPRYSVWQDKDSIPPGKDWWEAIVDAIIDCNVFIFMVSHESVQNINCRAELSYARRRNRPIIPFVLEGEFTYNTTSGKNDVSYWEHIPEELNDARAQFLFYEGVSFVQRLETAFDQFRRNPPHDLVARRPPDPRPAAEENSDTTVLYDQACDYAFRLEISTAERLFLRLVNANDPDFGQESHEWILILREYDQLIRWDARESTRYKAQAKWESYVKQFPKPFIHFFDPKNLRERYANGERETRHIDVVTPPVVAVPRTAAPTRPRSIDLLPAPFAWIDIPANEPTHKVKLTEGGYVPKGGQSFDVPAFAIAKYPLTNAQFRKFWDAKGYDHSEWWTDEGWQFKERENWTEPRHWQDSKWNKDDYPVVSVSWFEAMAFCLWLSDVTGENISLPTEQQWQRAAQGDTNWPYPWGEKFDKSRCNFNTKGTTPVTQYEGKGDSPFKVVDMSGNVWEWCLTDYEDGSQDINTEVNKRVLRGGSWNDFGENNLRAVYRSGGNSYDWGLRVARS